LFEITKWYF